MMQANRVGVTGLRPSPLPHHPACGFASLSLALRAAYRLAVSLRSAAPGGSDET
jgi:hypothetical protein